MNARELSDKLSYMGQIHDAKNIMYRTGRFTVKELSEMSDVELCDELLKDYVYITDSYNGEDILLIKKECVADFNNMAVWLRR